MIGRLSGTVVQRSGSVVTVDVQGVGYEVHCSSRALAELQEGERAQLVVYTEVKEDLIRLFGFGDELEKQVFLLLLKVKGIGARTGLEVISKIDRRELLKIIGVGDAAAIQRVPGIGRKTAERVVLELRDSVAGYALDQNSQLQVEVQVMEPGREAVDALQALGFSRKDAERAVGQVERAKNITTLDAAAIVKEALQYV